MADQTSAASTPPAETTLVTNPAANAAPNPAPDQAASLIAPNAAPNPPAPPVPEPAKPVVPEKYDLKLAEKSPLDQAHVEKLAAFAKERGLSQEQAQGLLDRDQLSFDQYRANTEVSRKAQAQAWVSDVKNDPELGNLNFDKTVELASRVVDRYGSPELKVILNSTGLGNHPELIRMISRIGKEMSNDQLVTANQTPEQKPRDLAEVLYPKK